jgi:Sulfotransferase family
MPISFKGRLAHSNQNPGLFESSASGQGVQPPKQKLIYILGSGRCGSTVFEIILGSHPNIRATGEFHTTPFPNWMPGAVCSCGQTFNLCPFWSPVREKYRAFLDFDRALTGQLRFESYRSLPRTLFHRMLRTNEIREHARGMSDLIKIISESSGKDIVSESSKNAVRGYLYALARSSDFEVYYIHLVRDGRGYIRSQMMTPHDAGSGEKKSAFSSWAITLRWVAPNLLAMLLCSRPRNRYLRIRYEDFVTRPVKTLEEVGRFVGLDMSALIEQVREGGVFPVTHLIGGNRVRFSPTISLESRFANPALIAHYDRWSFWALGGWMAFLYGYLHGGPDNGHKGSSV